MHEIHVALDAARAYLGQHPDEARYTDSVATATLAGGLRMELSGPGGEALATDMPSSIGGSGSAPSPGWLMRAAHASCVATLIAMRGAELGIRIDRLDVVASSESDDRGILGMDVDIPAGPLHSSIQVVLGLNAGDDLLREVVDWAVDHCPVHDALRRAVPVHVVVQLRP